MSFNFSIEIIPTRTSTTTKTGTSKVMPKAMKVDSTKSKYLPISVITATPSGAKCVMNSNTRGRAAKYAKVMPQIKRKLLTNTSGSTRRFSCEYSPGATNAQI